MRRGLLVAVVVAAGLAAVAQGGVVNRQVVAAEGVQRLSVTNGQANAVWAPVSLLCWFEETSGEDATVVVEVFKVVIDSSEGAVFPEVWYQLDSITLTTGMPQNFVWHADAETPFAQGEVFVFSMNGASAGGMVQLVTKAVEP